MKTSKNVSGLFCDYLDECRIDPIVNSFLRDDSIAEEIDATRGFDGFMNISKISTKELVNELKKREGVESMFIEPHESKDIHVDGFATVLIVID